MVWPSGSDTYRQEYAQQGSAFQSHDVPFAPITAGTWHHVQMIIDLDTATHTFSIDGMTLSSGATQYPVVPATTVVQDGMNYTNDPVPAWSLHTDNVTIDYQ